MGSDTLRRDLGASAPPAGAPTGLLRAPLRSGRPRERPTKPSVSLARENRWESSDALNAKRAPTAAGSLWATASGALALSRCPGDEA